MKRKSKAILFLAGTVVFLKSAGLSAQEEDLRPALRLSGQDIASDDLVDVKSSKRFLLETKETSVDDRSVEIFMGGKKYGSLKQYKLFNVKETLSQALSQMDIQDITDEELLMIIKEIRDGQMTSEQPDENEEEFERLMRDYYQKKGMSQKTDVDMGTMKTIVIEP